MSRGFRINARDALRDLRRQAQICRQVYGVVALPNQEWSCNVGGTFHDPFVSRWLYFGVSELSGWREHAPFVNASDLYVDALVSLYHEVAHYEQFKRLDSGAYPFCRDIASSLLCDEGSDLYHDANYALLPHEIEAEMAAFLMAYDHLSALFGEDGACDLLKRHVESHAGDMMHIVEPDMFKAYDRDGIRAAFEKQYAKASTTKRILTVPTTDVECACMSSAHRMLLDNIDGCKDCFEAYSGFEQDAVVASVVCSVEKTRHSMLYPGYEPIDLVGCKCRLDAVRVRQPIASVMLDEHISDELQL